MKRTALMLLAVGLLIAADDKDAAKQDLDKLQGEWTLESGERDGQAIPEEFVKSLKRVIKDNTSVVSRDGEALSKSTFKLDPTKKPKAIDITLEQEKDKPILGIYELDGDTFKICYGQPGGERPKEFSAKAGSGNTNSGWKRAKK
jgi:uncharacterized protein (TIGR03067 family)